MIDDMKVAPGASFYGAKVFDGFYDEWKSLRPCVKDYLKDLSDKFGTNIRVTGHSLGAATSSLAMLDCGLWGYNIVEAYNFGMPRTGDRSFSKSFTDKFKNVFVRMTYHQDIVVQNPPSWFGYHHVGPEVHYECCDDGVRENTLSACTCTSKGCSSDNDYSDDAKCGAGKYSWWGGNSVSDHLHYMGGWPHASGC